MSTLEPKTPNASLGFPRRARITRGAELQRIAREGKRIRTVHIEVRAAASPLARLPGEWKGIRVGLVVPRFKHTAVARNQLKRRLRELARTRIVPVMFAIDVVLKIRPEAYGATFDALSIDVIEALERLSQWHQKANQGISSQNIEITESGGTE